MEKTVLVNNIVNMLIKSGFSVAVAEGCFDIAARREHLMLVKILINIDSLGEEQAASLRTISYFLSAYPMVIAVKTNREFLKDGLVYSRFQLPVITPGMLDTVLEEEAVIQSAKGRHTVEIDATALREKRNEARMTMQELADAIGISKKALYEIETKRTNPTADTLEKLEKLLKVDLKVGYEMKAAGKACMKPKDEFERAVDKELKRMGMESSPVRSAPFEIVGKEKFSVITSLTKNGMKIKREARTVRSLSDIFSTKGFFVAKKAEEKAVSGVPVLLESELPEIESPKELKKVIKEKSE